MQLGPLVLAMAVALSGCATVPKDSASTPAARGEAVARRVCAACHAMGSGGESPSPQAAPLGSAEMRHTAGLPDRVADLTRTGHYGMPPLTLTPQEVSDVVAYIESLGSGDQAKSRDGDA